MTSATVVSLEECRQARIHAAARQQIHEHFDQWLDALEEHMPEKSPTLEQLTQAVFALRHELTGTITEALVGQAHHDVLEQRVMCCSQCGRLLRARATATRTVDTMVGAVSLHRPYFYCVSCRAGYAPLDDTLQLAPRRKQWDMQQAGTRLAAEVPYETASELFTDLTGLAWSDHILHAVMGEGGQGLTVLEVSPTADEIGQRVAQVAIGRTWRPILVLAIDGADVPLRPETAKGRRPGRKRARAKRARWQGHWREAKGFRFYLVADERIVHVLSWHQVQRDEDVAEALPQVQEAGLIPEASVRLCVVADGAKWIWTQVKALFPSAVQLLDDYHCSEHLHKVASLQFDHHPEQATEWMEATLARLFCGEVDEVIGGLQGMKASDAQAAEEIRKLIGYLTNNRGRVDYGFARKGGYPLGSGGIESAHKFISHVRLKRSGAWWYVEKANHMLALRCAKYNGTFARVFEVYKQRVMQSSGKTPL
jgi:Uncharacterised protein family (UPF0236)